MTASSAKLMTQSKTGKRFQGAGRVGVFSRVSHALKPDLFVCCDVMWCVVARMMMTDWMTTLKNTGCKLECL